MKPQTLPPNVLRHFYAGGERIAAFRGLEPESDHTPEEWLGAVNTTFGATDERGLSRTADGALVRDVIAADPEAWLGPEHVARFGSDPALLTKLLDAGERLPVHFHPGRAFAHAHLGLDHGKTEAWIILEASPGAAVHAGFRHDVDLETVREWMRTQASDAMLAVLHELPVQAGDTIFVPAGTPHAIGAGILMVELQEPTDLSVLLEYERFGMNSGSEHLGLGWERVLSAIDREAAPPPPADAPAGPLTGPVSELLPPEAAPYFRAQRVISAGEPVSLEPSFAILIVLDGPLVLADEHGHRLELPRGETVLIPHGAGTTALSGHGAAIRCLPPAPDAGEARW
jgi:mannose-6-phosphate isomerase